MWVGTGKDQRGRKEGRVSLKFAKFCLQLLIQGYATEKDLKTITNMNKAF